MPDTDKTGGVNENSYSLRSSAVSVVITQTGLDHVPVANIDLIGTVTAVLYTGVIGFVKKIFDEQR